MFYVKTSTKLREISNNYISLVSDRVIETLETTLLNVQHVGLVIANHEDTKKLILEDNPLVYHEKTRKVRKTLDSIYQKDGLIDEILLYDTNGIYCRLRGNLGNTSASKVGQVILQDKKAKHIVLNLEGDFYIGYITDIYQGNKQIGSIAFLMKGSYLEHMFYSYDESKSLHIGLMVGEEIIISSKKNDNIKEYEKSEGFRTIRQVGVTPFKVVVYDGGDSVKKTMQDFFFTSAITMLIIILILILYYIILDKIFFKPMISIINSAEKIGESTAQNQIELTGEEEFDKLVKQINKVIRRLEKNRSDLYLMNSEMQKAQLEKQRAIIISLKKQINAHFTINTLNVIKRLSETDQNEKAAKMCDGLSSMLRYANGAKEYIGGLEEMQILEKYVDIMLIRYPQRFTKTFDIDDQLDDILLPRMLIQPIIENAITHAILKNPKGQLKVIAKVRNKQVIILVKDDGKGIEKEELINLQTSIKTAPKLPWDEGGIEHIALPNIEKRIVSMFGNGYGITIKSQCNKGTTVRVTLPVIEKK